jgi:rare lipoprotein A
MKYLTIFFFSLLLISFTKVEPYTQVGRASYYANKFEGRRTSSGEIFKQNQLTAAHKTLKFGTLVKVTNLKNDSTVVVKINDRLSKSSSSVIDLTTKAAKQLNFIRNGHAQVKIEESEKLDVK